MSDGIRKMEGTIEEVKEWVNKTLTPMQVIEEPESAIIVNLAFEMMEGYLRLEKEKTELLNKINDKLETVNSLEREIEALRREIANMRKES